MRRTGLKNLLVEYWQPFAYYGALLLVFGGLLWFRLGTLVDGYSGHELQTLQSSLSLKHIFENPINAPFTLLGRGLLYLGDQGIFWMRIVASFFGLLTITVFYWLVRHWHGERSAFLGTLV